MYFKRQLTPLAYRPGYRPEGTRRELRNFVRVKAALGANSRGG
ncbi:MAG: hypothetical protein U9R58_05495 [Chloroflexota bacterium]|nr:hypothetical protein [Chloroflexota bacterium]